VAYFFFCYRQKGRLIYCTGVSLVNLAYKLAATYDPQQKNQLAGCFTEAANQVISPQGLLIKQN
jgi:hypothetical protein